MNSDNPELTPDQIKYHKILKSFCTEYQGDLDHISVCDWLGSSYACATNGHMAILVPYSLTKGYEERDEYPDVAKVMPTPGDSPGYIKRDHLSVILNSLKTTMLYGTEECDECDGDGSFEYGSHEYECKECDGYGDIKGEEIGLGIGPDSIVVCGGTQYNPRLLSIVFDTMTILKENAQILTGEETIRTLLKVGECFILVMGMMPINEGKEDFPIIQISKNNE